MSVNATGAVNSGVVNATTSFDIAGTPFAFGSYRKARTHFSGCGELHDDGLLQHRHGLAGASPAHGRQQHRQRLMGACSNTTGTNNTANGFDALNSNTTGTNNTASGISALYSNITGATTPQTGSTRFTEHHGQPQHRQRSPRSFPTPRATSNTASGSRAWTPTPRAATTPPAVRRARQQHHGQQQHRQRGLHVSIQRLGTFLTCIGYYCATSVDGLTNATAIGANAMVGESNALVLGSISGVNSATSSTNVGIGTTTPQYTLDVNGNANFSGNVSIGGSVSKGSGSFKIDHPLDPANKYLYHSFVESPDMMNVYNGNVVTDKNGTATVVLPEYFEALNRDFRYQLTVIGQFAQAIVASEMSHNQFTIRTDKPKVKVSWQVTGIRHDAYANAHRDPGGRRQASNRNRATTSTPNSSAHLQNRPSAIKRPRHRHTPRLRVYQCRRLRRPR